MYDWIWFVPDAIMATFTVTMCLGVVEDLKKSGPELAHLFLLAPGLLYVLARVF